MEFAKDAFPKWLALLARANNTPYAEIMKIVERLGNDLEAEDTCFEDWTVLLKRIEQAERYTLSVNDVGEILVLLGNYWQDGQEFLEDGIDYLAQKLVAENVEHRLSVLAQHARGETNE